MTAAEYYKEVRDHIKHEDGLCNQRMTWLITLHAFLFGAYGFSLSAASGTHGTDIANEIHAARIGLALFGILSSVAILASLYAATRSIDRLVKAWINKYPTEVSKFPQIIGNYESRNRMGTFLGQIPLFAIPVVTPLIWVYLLVGLPFLKYLAIGAGIFGVAGCLVYLGYLAGSRPTDKTADPSTATGDRKSPNTSKDAAGDTG